MEANQTLAAVQWLEPDPQPAPKLRPIKVSAYLDSRKDDIRESCKAYGYSRAADKRRADWLNVSAKVGGYALSKPITADFLSVWRSQNDLVSCRRPRRARVVAVRGPVLTPRGFRRILAWIGLVKP